MKTSTTLLGLFAASQEAAAAAGKWTPEDFDWEKMPQVHNAVYQNVSSGPPTRELVAFAGQAHNMTEDQVATVQRLSISTAIGWVKRSPITIVTEAAGVADTINTCVGAYEDTTFRNSFFCGLGVAATIGGFGVAQSADKELVKRAAKYFAKNRAASDGDGADNSFSGTGLESIALEYFSDSDVERRDTWRRGLHARGFSDHEYHNQILHDHMTHHLVRRAGFTDGEFIGYEDETHKLSRVDGVHPLVPRFRFTHHTHGRMVLSTRDTNTTRHMTLAPFFEDHEISRLKRDNEFEKESLQTHLMEGRFDREASEADTNDLNADAEGSFRMVEDSLECFVGDEGMDSWPANGVFDMQMYDNTNKMTFGYGSIGIFDDHGRDADFAGLQPQPPVSGGMDC